MSGGLIRVKGIKKVKPTLFIFFILALWLVPGGYLSALDIKVERLNEQDFETLMETNKGRVVLLNVWATWCKPCREEFPDLLKVKTYYKDKDVSIISISADYPDEIESKILPFLKSFKTINFPVYVQDFKKADEFINRLHKEWNGALPATFIYDKTGKQQAFFIGKKDVKGFKAEIEKVRKLK